MPVPPKPPERRQRRNTRNDVGLVERDGLPIPAPDRAWLKRTADAWFEYWESPVSGLVKRDSDLLAVKRLFDYRDEHARALASFRKDRLSAGSTGQLKLSPMGEMMMKLEKLILPLEDRYGLSSMARLRLGAELGEATKSLAEMNAALAAEIPEGGDGDDYYDDAIVYQLPGLPAAE